MTHDWYCPRCKEWLDGLVVTFDETHDTRDGGCGCPVMDHEDGLLMNAAPALLEACEKALAFCRSINNIDYDYESTLGDVEDLLYVAIAKARSE